MTSAQKIIKYLALAFAAFLIFSIVSSIMYVVLSFTNIFDSDNHVVDKIEELKVTEGASVLDVQVNTADIIIKQGESFKIETNNKYIEVNEDGNKLFINETRNNWFGNRSDSKLLIYVPINFVFDGVVIESDAGKIEVDNLLTKNLVLDLGAGKTTINNLVVYEEASIDGGAGKISIGNGLINNLDFDMGVGELSLSSKITGDSDIDAGIGKIRLNLIGTDYKIKVDKGIGSSIINGQSIKDETYYGNGMNIINIDGGVGNIDISYGN